MESKQTFALKTAERPFVFLERLKEPQQLLFVVLFAAALGLRLFFALATPVYYDAEEDSRIRPFNDEYLHFKYSEYLMEQRRFPVHLHIRDAADPELVEVYWIFNEAEYAQPPLYYLLNAPFTALSQPIIASRLFSVFLSSLLLVLAVSCARLLAQKPDRAALLTVAFLGFHPLLIRIGSSVSNDILSWLLSMILFRLFLSNEWWKRKWLFGFLIGLGILTRISFALWPIFLLSKILWDQWKNRAPAPFFELLKNYFLMIGVSFLIHGWWLFRSYLIYGDPTGVSALAWLSYVSSGSLYAIEKFFLSFIQFSFFPIAEQPARPFIVATGFFILLIFALAFQRNAIRAQFSDGLVYRDMVLFNCLNLLIFLMTNLRFEYPESRHLLIGLLPLSAVITTAFHSVMGGVAVALLAVLNLICLFGFLF